MTAQATTLEMFLDEEASVSAPVAEAIRALALTAETLAKVISGGSVTGRLGEEVGANSDGDRQKALDVVADELFAKALASTPVRWYASEERTDTQLLNPEGVLALAIDPLDGSSNIDVNISIGTIFSIFDAKETGWESFQRPGREQIAAGYFIYGPQTVLVLATTDSVAHFVLYDGAFVLSCANMRIPDRSTEFAINASNYRHWTAPIRAFIDDCLAGEEGPWGENLNMRWVASLVAEANRILLRGGIFLYPADARRGYASGRLRLVYECAPIAFIVERAGGKATDGIDPILDQTPSELHQRTPLVFGSADKVSRVSAYHDLPESEVSPLFGKRGLFRS